MDRSTVVLALYFADAAPCFAGGVVGFECCKLVMKPPMQVPTKGNQT